MAMPGMDCIAQKYQDGRSIDIGSQSFHKRHCGKPARRHLLVLIVPCEVYHARLRIPFSDAVVEALQMDLRYRSRITVPLGSTIIPSRGLKSCLQLTSDPRLDLLLHSSQSLPVSWAEQPPFKPSTPRQPTSFAERQQPHTRTMSTSLYLELPWKGTRQMLGDIAGFIGVTLLLIIIDSYILCEQQNAARIFCSIGIDYAILFTYIAVRNVAMANEPGTSARTQPQMSQCQAKQQDYK